METEIQWLKDLKWELDQHCMGEDQSDVTNCEMFIRKIVKDRIREVSHKN